MNPLSWIPNAFKGMLEVMKDAQKMAGGGWKGQLVFWLGFFMFVVAFVLFIVWATKPAYDNLAEVLGHFNISITQVDVNIPSTFWANLFISLLVSIMSLIFLAGLGIAIGSFLGLFTSIVFSPYTTYRIDKLFSQLIPLIEKQNDKSLLAEANKVYASWSRSKFTRITKFVTTKRAKERFEKTKL